MMDTPTRKRANDVIERLFLLGDAIKTARAFRCLLEDLHSRNLASLQGPHVNPVRIVRAAILRSLIGTLMACLDKRGRDRASVGQILFMLNEHTDLLDAFRMSGGLNAESQKRSLAEVRTGYVNLGEHEKSGRNLRDEAIAHILSREPTEVEYETIYYLHDEAERLATLLYHVCDRGAPDFDEDRPKFEEAARVFWATYFAGVDAR
jgi:AbiU2